MRKLKKSNLAKRRKKQYSKILKFKEFMGLFDNWSAVLKVNDNNLDFIVKDRAMIIMEKRKDLYDKEVVAFGYYNDELCVRVK